jgi:hypothetical protein
VRRVGWDLPLMVGLTTLLGISDNAVFEFHVANWPGEATTGLPTAPELEKWRGARRPSQRNAARYAVPNSRSILATASRIFGRN